MFVVILSSVNKQDYWIRMEVSLKFGVKWLPTGTLFLLQGTKFQHLFSAFWWQNSHRNFLKHRRCADNQIKRILTLYAPCLRSLYRVGQIVIRQERVQISLMLHSLLVKSFMRFLEALCYFFFLWINRKLPPTLLNCANFRALSVCQNWSAGPVS